MAFSLSLPSIGQFFRKFYPMKIYKEGGEILPCDIVEIVLNKAYNIPQQPLDTMQYAGDTIYKKPLNLSLRVFVRLNDFDNFVKMLEKMQFEKEGFVVSNAHNFLYKNLRIVSYNYNQNSEYNNAYFFNIEMQELILINAKILNFSMENVKSASYSQTIEKGQVTNDKKSVAKKLFEMALK